MFPRFQLNPANLGRNDRKLSPLLFERVAQSLESIAVGAVRRKRADPSALEGRLGLTDERQGWRWIKIHRRSIRRDFRPLPFHADRDLDPARQSLVDQSQMTQHASANDRCFDL